jgi:hypothetical protein
MSTTNTPAQGIKPRQFDDSGNLIPVAEAPEPLYLLRRRIALAEKRLPGLMDHLCPKHEEHIAQLKAELAARLQQEAA